MSKFSTVREMFQFLKRLNKFWLYPIVLFLLFLGWFMFAAKSSAVAPLMYAMF